LLPICVHLTAVFSEPFHFFSRSEVQTAADANLLRSWLHPYSQWMYLDHGYFFFAPNPGPGHLLRISASDDPLPQLPSSTSSSIEVYPAIETDSDITVITFPDRKLQKPRLLYHRYFMLSEFYYNRYAPFEITEELSSDPVLSERWKIDRRLYTSIQESIVSHVKHKTGKGFVRLDRLERMLPDRVSILQKNIRLTDPQWISVLPETMSPSSLSRAPQPTSDATPQPSPLEDVEVVPAPNRPAREKGR
jgi:hypothetical protein